MLIRSLAVSSSTLSYVELGLRFMRTGAVDDFDSVSHQTVPAQTIFDMTKLLPGTHVRVNGDVTWTGEAIKGWLGPLFTIDGRSFARLFWAIPSFSPDRHSPSNRYKHHIRRASSLVLSLTLLYVPYPHLHSSLNRVVDTLSTARERSSELCLTERAHSA